jgi:flagellar hook-length control protein FliK
MLETLPISPSSNNGFPESPRGVRGSERDAGGFLSFFEAAAAAKRDSDGCSKPAIEEKNDGKAGCKEKSAPSKDSSLSVKSESGSLKEENADEEVANLEDGTETSVDKAEEDPFPLQDDLQPPASPGLLLGLSNDEPISENGSTSESREGEISLSGNPKRSSGGSPQNPVVEKENDIQVVAPLKDSETARPESANGENASLKGASPLNPKGKPILEASRQQIGEKDGGEGFAETVAKSLVYGSEGSTAEAKNRFGVDGEQNINIENGAEGTTTKKGKKTLVGATAKSIRPDAATDIVQGKSGLTPLKNSDPPLEGLSKRSGKFSYEPRILKESGKARDSEKTTFSSKGSDLSQDRLLKPMASVGKEGYEPVLSSKGSDLSQDRLLKPMASVGKEGYEPVLSSKGSDVSQKEAEKSTASVDNGRFETVMAARSEQKGRVTMDDKETASKESTNSKPSEGNAAGTKDTISMQRNGVSSVQVRPAVDTISMDIKKAEQNDQRQKDAPLKAVETSEQVANIREAEAHSSKPGSGNREDFVDAEKRFSQDKAFHGVAEKAGLTKEEDVIPVSKARYASDTSLVATETEKEVQKSSRGKEQLGPLVRTAAFLLKNGRQEAKMALHPESLGHLKIRISTENHQVTVRFMAETAAAKDLIEHNLHQLKADFQSQGLEVQKFEVSLSQDSGRNGAGYNPSSAGNRTRHKATGKREENLRQDEESSRIASTATSAARNSAVDFFA